VDYAVLVIFVLVYLGMLLGRIPGLALDRTGVALLGAIALLAIGRIGLEEAWLAIDVPTIALLLGLMVVSAQFRLGGFYTAVTSRLALADLSPPKLLALLIVTTGGLSAILANDIICLAMTPVMIHGCIRRRLDPIPFALALACAANVGSAATLIGNPQNMLIGQALELSFAGYLLEAIVPAIVGSAIIWLVIVWQVAGKWEMPGSPAAQTGGEIAADAPAFNAWQTAKGVAVVLVVMFAFLFTDWPREIVALGAAGVLLLSRKMASQKMLGLVDWHLLVLFIGLFIVNHAFAASGILDQLADSLRQIGIEPTEPGWLFVLSAVLSNLVSNVPAVMLLLPFAEHGMAGPVLAISSTLAGNLIIVGSIANIIVIDHAHRQGVHIDWKRHARTGIPVTLASLVFAAAWLWLRAS
jgi:Na+/H+ antiporter NhaD/arsenite permease-like protein